MWYPYVQVLMAVSPAESSSHETLCTLRFSSLISQVYTYIYVCYVCTLTLTYVWDFLHAALLVSHWSRYVNTHDIHHIQCHGIFMSLSWWFLSFSVWAGQAQEGQQYAWRRRGGHGHCWLRISRETRCCWGGTVGNSETGRFQEAKDMSFLSPHLHTCVHVYTRVYTCVWYMYIYTCAHWHIY